MRILRNTFLAAALVAPMAGLAVQTQHVTLVEVVDRISQRENQEAAMLQSYAPIMETYVQDVRPDKELGLATVTDHYFLGRFKGFRATSRFQKEGEKERSPQLSSLGGTFSTESVQDDIARMTYVDIEGFDPKHYSFDYVRHEQLGEVLCLVFDVTPLAGVKDRDFRGRIWVEDQDYTTVRINGALARRGNRHDQQVHYDSWRINVAPGIWVPAYIYSEVSDSHHSVVGSRGTTDFWGYNPKPANDETGLFHAESQHAEEATERAIYMLEAAGLLAPKGDVDKMLCAVVNDLENTSNLHIEPGVKCRVMLTSTMESFTIGHTIVVSRGLLDVLPDEASLAMIFAHEVGHVLTGLPHAEQWTSNHWSIYSSEAGFNHFGFPIDTHEEGAANQKAMELLRKSPYKDNLLNAGLFLQVVRSQSKTLPNLISPHIESRAALAEVSAATRERHIGALPLGSRIKLNPWTDEIEMTRSRPPGNLSAGLPRDELVFEVMPKSLYLARSYPPDQH